MKRKAAELTDDESPTDAVDAASSPGQRRYERVLKRLMLAEHGKDIRQRLRQTKARMASRVGARLEQLDRSLDERLLERPHLAGFLELFGLKVHHSATTTTAPIAGSSPPCSPPSAPSSRASSLTPPAPQELPGTPGSVSGRSVSSAGSSTTNGDAGAGDAAGSPEEGGSSLPSRHRTFNMHSFRNITTVRPKSCHDCGALCFGLAFQAWRCELCDLVFHERHIENAAMCTVALSEAHAAAAAAEDDHAKNANDKC